MKFTDRVKNAVTAFTTNEAKQAEKNSKSLATDFLRYGNKSGTLYQDWSQVEMSDQDMYTGYSYAAIKKRANRASVLGKRFLYTIGSPKAEEAARKAERELEHPYLHLIKKSKEFSQRKFWHDISTYLDLEGVYYLMAVRAISDNTDGTKKVGAVQKFVMLNPYQVRRVIKESDGTVGGYIESRNGMYREIPKEMIIEIRLLNPFNQDEAFSMTDAAKESQFTLKQSGDYTRHAIKGNINAPGAITTDVVLEDNIFDNFVSRIKNHSKGEPIYGNGAGAINWQSMQIDLDKAGLDKINEINRAILFSVSGTSKTMMGIEESGTGREVSKTQKDDFTENAVMPQIEDIIDALNLDYRRWYPEWEEDEYEIVLDNPLESDREAELKDIEIRERKIEVRETLISMGYEYDVAARYAEGEVTITELGEPTYEEEISDLEAEAAAMRELGFTDEEIESDLMPEMNKLQKVENRMVPRGTNDEKMKEARLRVRKRLDKKAEDARLKEIAEKEAIRAQVEERKKEKQREEEERQRQKEQEETEVTPKPENLPQEEVQPTSKVEVVAPQANSVEESRKILNQIAARDIPDLYDGMGIDFDKIGCIMMNTEKMPVLQYIENGINDVNTDGDHTGVVGETEAHVTLLYGLLENGHIWKEKVDKVLEGWELPTVTVERVSYFDLGDKYAVVALLEKSDELIDGHQRLTLLPHINTFSEYHPHITLVYLNKEADVQKWVKKLGKRYDGVVVATTGLNYGDLPEEEANDSNSDTKSENSVPNEAKQAVLSPVEGAKSHDCNEHVLDTNSTLEKATNALEPSEKQTVALQESDLYAGIARLEQDVTLTALDHLIEDEDYDEDMLITESEEERFIDELTLLLAGFYLILFPVYGKQLMAERAGSHGSQGVFAMTDSIEQYINKFARKGAESHISTILKDLKRAAGIAIGNAIEDSMVDIVEEGVRKQDPAILGKLGNNPNREDIVKAVKKGVFDDEPIYSRARELARQGKGRDAIARQLRKEYQNMTRNRATTIARHETNRVFNMAQYQADLQFLTESGLINNAYKILKNRADDPCPICAKLIQNSRENPIPFNKNFANLGDVITNTYTKPNGKKGTMTFTVDYEPITAGNVHVNCRCEYELVIIQDDGTVLNAVDAIKAINSKSYNPYRDSRGRFASGPTADGRLDYGGATASEAAKYLSDTYGKNLYKGKADKAISAYASTLYAAINGGLRRGGKNSDFVDASAKEAVKDLDAAMKKVQLKENLTVYRGAANKRNQQFEVGQVIKDNGYSSTSLSEDSAMGFLGESDTTPYVMKIVAKKGQNAIIPGLAESASQSVAHEVEVILPRGTAYKITKIREKQDSFGYDYNELEMEIV